MTENRMTTWDGSELFYRAWLPKKPSTRAIVIFHRGHEHSGRLINLVRELNLADYAIFAWDARGNGLSPGRRDYAENFMDYVRDADVFVRHLSGKYGFAVENLAVIANSVGAVIATAWVHDYAPPIKALVLATPAFRIKLYVPFAIPGLRAALACGLMKNVKSYVKSKVLTHDTAEQQRFNGDDLITNSIATNILLDVYDTSTRLIKDAGAIRCPVLLLMAGSDWVVKCGAQRKFFERLSSPTKESEFYTDFYHAIYHEKERAAPIARTRDFIIRQFEHSHSLPTLKDAHRGGFTKREFDALNQSGSNPFYLLNRLFIGTLGRLSNGIRLGMKDGFDSGVTLDYVYRNKAKGITPIGKLIDYFYLNSVGWKGIRLRKVNLMELVTQAIQKLQARDQPVHIVDVAAGPGRYLLETLAQFQDDHITAELRDYKDVNVTEGRKLAEEMGLKDVIHVRGDAFNRQELAELSPEPNIAVISGLFELIPDNELLERTLSGLAEAVQPDGYLIYTNQPWHPQLEYIAKVLSNREGDMWVMRRRTQEEMDELVRMAGFEKMEMRIDHWGIFTVSIAQRRNS